jgi:hypothetical protein
MQARKRAVGFDQGSSCLLLDAILSVTLRTLLRGRPALSRSRTVTFTGSRWSVRISSRTLREIDTGTFLRRLGPIENLVEPSFSTRLRADGEAEPGAGSDTGLAV